MTHIRHASITRALLLFFSTLVLLVGCDTVSYYSQGIKGHFQLVSQIQPISEVLAHKDTPATTRQLLKQAILAKDFATKVLKLPDNQSYQGYADLHRDHVTWVVVATQPLSMDLYQSCFPITGCLSYRGYFTKTVAQQFADKLQSKNYETYIGGSSAYSTLGWFKDPIVSPMLRFGDLRLIETLFHELAHQQLYIKDDSDFNEAFATAVGQNGTKEWLRKTNPQRLADYNQYLVRYNGFLKVIGHTAKQLKTAFASTLSEQKKHLKKQQLLAQLQQDYQHYKQQNNDYSGYDNWFKKPINNPRLAMISVYHELVPDFNRWLKACDNDYSRFYQIVGRIAKLPKNERIKTLKKTAHCDENQTFLQSDTLPMN